MRYFRLLASHTQEDLFPFAQLCDKRFELRQSLQGFYCIHQHDLNVAQVVERIKPALQVFARFLNIGTRIERSDDIEYGQEPSRGHAQVVHGFFRKLVTTEFKLSAVAFPTLFQ